MCPIKAENRAQQRLSLWWTLLHITFLLQWPLDGEMGSQPQLSLAAPRRRTHGEQLVVVCDKLTP